ncbi:hypothetical protein D6O12_25245 [Salmonella enterica]|nr:hypothetical protein [Salmonella enterica]
MGHSGYLPVTAAELTTLTQDRGIHICVYSPRLWLAPCGLKTNGTVYLNTQIYCRGQPINEKASFPIIDGQATGTLYPPSYDKKIAPGVVHILFQSNREYSWVRRRQSSAQMTLNQILIRSGLALKE